MVSAFGRVKGGGGGGGSEDGAKFWPDVIRWGLGAGCFAARSLDCWYDG